MYMSYQVIARTYRPKQFRDVVGQDAIITLLKNSLSQNRTAHAYLFCGSRGTGKTTLARLFAKALNCSHRSEEGEPCGLCASCRAITQGSSLDVLEIDGASHRGIDDIRAINETLAYSPSGGHFKIYIIDEVHMLTKEAFNALLKTLEEPPRNVKFIFATTEPHKIPETIISRCQRFDLLRISEEKSVSKLAKICEDLQRKVDLNVLRLIAHRSKGGLRDAESMLDQLLNCPTDTPIDLSLATACLKIPSHEYFFRLDALSHTGSIDCAITLPEELLEKGLDLSLFLEELAEHYRRILFLQCNPSYIDDKLFSWFDEATRKNYTASSKLYTLEQSYFILGVIVEWLQKITKSPYPKLILEHVLLSILRSKSRISIDAVIEKLSTLENSIESAMPKPPKTDSSSCFGIQHKDTPPPPDPSIKHETVLRFAAVELEGSLKKEK